MTGRLRFRAPAAAIVALAAGLTWSTSPRAQSPQTPQAKSDDGAAHVEHVRGNIYLLGSRGGNVTVQVGPEGLLLVDTSTAEAAPQIVAALRKLSNGPIRYIINTHPHPDHVGGNGSVAKAAAPTPTLPLNIVAHENVLNRLTASSDRGQPLVPEEGMPVDEYFTPVKNLHFNDEAVVVYHEPKAHTDGDSIVLFRGSDVLSTGDIFTPGGYPFIDLEQGGTVQGEIAALNHILQLTVPAKNQEGGTYVIPGHGRICDSADVVEFRDMVVIVRDRVQDLMKKGMTLEQIKAAKVTRDYDTEYVTPESFVKADQFVETMYKGLGGK
jgi:glyoxylase-like metal-dependent hydrolase (beta-lactamase superfamily II)